MKEFSVPYLTYHDLRDCANRFLDTYHPTRTIPVPIEEIVEFDVSADVIQRRVAYDKLQEKYSHLR